MDPKVSFHFKHNKFHVTADASVVTIVDGVITINTRVSYDGEESGGPRVEVDDVASAQAAAQPPNTKLSVMEAVKQAALRRPAMARDKVYGLAEMTRKLKLKADAGVYYRVSRGDDPLPVVRVVNGGKTKYGFPKDEVDAWVKRQGGKA